MKGPKRGKLEHKVKWKGISEMESLMDETNKLLDELWA